MRGVKSSSRSRQEACITALSRHIVDCWFPTDQDWDRDLTTYLRKEIYFTVCRCFLDDVHSICSSQSPDRQLLNLSLYGTLGMPGSQVSTVQCSTMGDLKFHKINGEKLFYDWDIYFSYLGMIRVNQSYVNLDTMDSQ